jgi:pimeloyl-ACP methyl ester carboxylesterase
MPYLELTDARIYHEVSGAGRPAVVLVHGAMCGHGDWASQVRDLSGRFTVVTPDLRGHGRSAAPYASCDVERFGLDLAALIEELGIAPAVLVGHSFGARAVIETAARHPGLVAGLVLLDASRMHEAGADAELPPVCGLTDEQVTARIAGLIEDAVGPFAAVPVAGHIRRTMSAAPLGLKRAYLAASRRWDASRFDAALALLPPVLPVLAVQSTYVSYRVRRHPLTQRTTTTPFLDYLAGQLPQVRTVILAGVGHFSMLEAPAKVSHLIWDFAEESRNANAAQY